MPVIPATDPRLTWSGALSLEQGPGWVKPWRVPHGDLDLYSPGASGLAERAEMPSGVGGITVIGVTADLTPRKFDLCCINFDPTYLSGFDPGINDAIL